jgi:hypothetical protein
LDKALPPVPYSIAWGNHDSVLASDSLYESYFGLTSGQKFGVTNFIDYPWWGGNFGLKGPTRNENNYQLFSAGGDDYLVIHLAYMNDPLLAYETTLAAETNDDGTVRNAKTRLRWVDSVLKANSSRKAILTTHDFLTPAGVRTASANFIWDQVIVPNPNVFLIMNGHQLGTQAEARRSEYVNGRWCHQVLANYQSRQNGGNGWLRVLDFSPAEKKIRVKTYSPSLNQYETDANSQFELVLGNDPGSSADEIDPLVSITAPASGAFIAGTAVTVSANASDNVGVTGVQFKLDGAYLGIEDAVPPYTVTFDSTKFANGTHVLSARSRDAAGNIAIAEINITIANGVSDYDADGLPDTWELQYFGSISDPQAAPHSDPDGDGYSNEKEYKAKTSPMDRSSRLSVATQILSSPTSFQIQWQSVVGVSYAIQSTSDLVIWTPVETVVAGSTNSVWTDMTLSAENKKFYRVTVQ